MRGIQSAVLTALLGVALIGFMASADAAGVVVTTSGDIVTVTFTGTVSSSNDPDGTFGCTTNCTQDPDSGAGPYDGDTYTAVYTFNTSEYAENVPGVLVRGSSLPPVDGMTPPSPLVGDATVTVNGVTYDLGGSNYATLYSNSFDETPGALPNYLTANVLDANGNQIMSYVATTSDPPQFPVSITTPFGPIDFGSSGGSQIDFDCVGPSDDPTCAGFIDADITASLVNNSAVPEPSTWVMMAVGFAGLAFAGYRRKRIAAIA